MLSKVDFQISYVARGGQDSEINWEDACSLGEKQRLAIARLIWHKPQFASAARTSLPFLFVRALN